MKKNKRLIDLYYEWMVDGKMVYDGLCASLPLKKYDKTLDLFEPTFDDMRLLRKEHKPTVYWGCGKSWNDMGDGQSIGDTFTPLRQTITLLIACMHNEY